MPESFSNSNQPHTPDFDVAPDDVDRLFAHLERAAVPPELTARVLANTVHRSDARSVVAWPWMLAGLGAFGVLVLAGYQVGATLAAADGLPLIEAILADLGLLATAPGDVLAAFGDIVPWPLIVLATISATLLVWVAGHIVTHPSNQLAARGRPLA